MPAADDSPVDLGAGRAELAEILGDCGVHYLRDEGLEEAFTAGAANPAIADLAVDSLAAMELCIALELRYGSTLVPSTLARVGTLDDLVARLASDRP